jgi:hypothetical protein
VVILIVYIHIYTYILSVKISNYYNEKGILVSELKVKVSLYGAMKAYGGVDV